jgi:hypothetical protein
MKVRDIATQVARRTSSFVGAAVARRHARRLQQLTDEEERSVLDAVLTRGLDQGWFLRVGESDLVPGSPGAQEEILKAVLSRSGSARPSADDPYLDFDYPVEPISGDTPGFMVVTQKCDLLGAIRKEPMVELVRVRKTADQDELAGIRKVSPRYFGIQDNKEFAWIADLRSHAFLPKDALLTIGGHHVMNRDQRRRFCLRLGDRYERQPIPTALVDVLQRPLIDFLKKAANVKHAAHFEDWRVVLHNPKPTVVAITATGVDRHVAEDAFEALQKAMPDTISDVFDQEQSRVILFEELTFALWVNSISLDLDQVTYSKGARSDPGHAQRVR